MSDQKKYLVDLSKYLDLTHQTEHDGLEKFDKMAAAGKYNTVKAAKDYMHSLLPGDGENILDIGIAGAYSTRELSLKYGNVTGVSICEDDIVHAKNFGLNAILSDMHNLKDIPDNSQDGIFASHVLEHSPAPHVALSEFSRVLKKDGWLAVAVPERDGIAGKGQRRIGFFSTHLFCPDPTTMIYMLRKSNFRFEWYREIPQFDPRFIQPNIYHQYYLARKGEYVDGMI